jgi:ferredoxin-like protein FixX
MIIEYKDNVIPIAHEEVHAMSKKEANVIKMNPNDPRFRKEEPEIKLNIKDLMFRSDKDTGDFISLDGSKCNGCGDCTKICAVNVWSVAQDKKARLSPNYKKLCLECAGCWSICDQEAIQFKYPKGGSGVIIKYG